MSKFVMSSGHGLYIRGASGYLDEVNEARRQVEEVARVMRERGHEVVVFHDNVSTNQSDNLNRIVDFHNAQGEHELSASYHFNAYTTTSKAMGCEVLYYSQQSLASRVSNGISVSGKFINRGAKKRTDLKFLNSTNYPAILLETCFVDSAADADLWKKGFSAICASIASTVAGGTTEPLPPEPEPAPPGALFEAAGKCSWFGGPDDLGVEPDEGLAFIFELDDAPHLFLVEQPPNTTGLARRLDPDTYYVACRWDYTKTPKNMLRDHRLKALVRANGKEMLAYTADWGPHTSTSRVADLSPGLMAALGLKTDDQVEIVFPAPQE